MIRCACALALVTVLGGCVVRTPDVPMVRRSAPPPAEPAPQPAPAPAPAANPIPSEFAHLAVRTSFEAKGNVNLESGFYRGDFRLTGSAATLTGAGKDKTVIEGNLFIKTQCTVKNMTVLGKVVFMGNQNDLKDVDFRGGIDDKGVQNRYQ